VFVDINGRFTFGLERCLVELFKASRQAQPYCFCGFYWVYFAGS
jgi:hypothetical protein